MRAVATSKDSAIAALVSAFALFACFADSSFAADAREPDRRELWVPSKDLQEILKKHPDAVLIDRAQYEALIRDAGRVNPEDTKEKPPVEAVIEGVKIRAELAGGAMTIAIKAEVNVNVLTDQWTQVKLLSVPPDVVLMRFGRSDVITREEPAAKGQQQRVLAIRGQGRHRVEMEFRSPIRRSGLVCHADVPYLSKPFSITAVPSGTARVSPRWPLHDGVAIVPMTSASASSTFATLTWIEDAAAGSNAGEVITEAVDSLTDVSKAGITTHVRVRLDATNGVLPMTFRLRLPSPDVNVVSVSSSYVAAWKQAGGALEITRRGGFMQQRGFSFVLLKPLSDSADTIAVSVDVPRYEGAALVTVNAGLHVGEGFEMLKWETPGREPDDAFRAWEKTQRPSTDVTVLRRFDVAPDLINATIRRSGDRFSADVDNHVVLSTHEMTLDRTIALHGEEGRVDRATFSIPANEQFLGLSAASGEKIEWKQISGSADSLVRNDPANTAERTVRAPSFEITWPGGMKKGQGTTLWLKTRQDLPAEFNGESPKSKVQSPKLGFTVENIRLAGTTRVAGYVALDFDNSWKVATTETTGLETRDARTTPVHGRMAWFTLRDYKLALDIARNESVLDAAIVAYALPRAKNVEIEGQFMLNASRAPLRKFDVRLAPAIAKLLRVDSPLIGEQSLDEAAGVWHFALRKELLGAANVRWRMSLAASPKSEVQGPKSDTDKAAQDSGPGTQDSGLRTLVAALPDIALPAAHHFSGQWIVEANTDTEISFATKGVQPVDSLHASPVEGYAPRHRVIAAYGYSAAPHEVKLTVTRHDPSPLVSALVEDMRLTSVLGRDGSSRHEAALRVRHNGQQFFALRVPQGATILSAKVGGETVKPVRAGEDEVRVPLASRIGAEASVPVTIVYELGGSPWRASGAEKIAPPTVADDVPVLSASWRVYAPDEMTYHASGGFAGEPERRVAPLLLGRVGALSEEVASSIWKTTESLMLGGNIVMRKSREISSRGVPATDMPMAEPKPDPFAAVAASPAGATSFYSDKLQRIIIPTIQFQGASIEEALEFLRVRSKDLDTMERDPSRRGINLILREGAVKSAAQITLDLHDIPMIEALRYITELAGMKYKIEPYAVVVMPVMDVGAEQYTHSFKASPDLFMVNGRLGDAKEVLKAAGISFPEGSSAFYNPKTSMLVVKNTQPNLDAIEAFNDSLLKSVSDPDLSDLDKATELAKSGRYVDAKEILKNVLARNKAHPGAVRLLRQLDSPESYEPALTPAHVAYKKSDIRNAKSGLISLDLDVPTSGRLIEFSGHQKPGPMLLQYESWERQMRRSALWALAGMAAFLVMGRRSPWLSTIFVALVLTCVPLLWLPAWIVACNAFLAGWLSMFVAHLLWRIARRIEGCCVRFVKPSAAVTASLVMMAGALTIHADDAQKPLPDPAAHTVIVPYDGTKPPDQQKADRYYLDYDVFQKLWELAKENRRPPKPEDLDKGVKPEAVITSALYDAQVRDDGLQLTARLSVITRGGPWVKLTLPFKGAAFAVGAAKLDGNVIALANGEMLIEKPGAHSVEISLSVPMGKGWRKLAVDLPKAAASVASVTVPASDGRPEFGQTNDALVMEETRNGQRVFTLPLGGANKLDISRTTARLPGSKTPPATANNELRLEILSRLERVHAELRFGFAGTERDRFEIVADESLLPVKWDAPGLRDLRMRKENGKLLVEATLLRPVVDEYVIKLDAERVLGADAGQRTAPLINGSARSASGVMDVKFSGGLQFTPGAGAARVASNSAKNDGLSDGGSFRVNDGAPFSYTVSAAEDRSFAEVDALYQLSAQKAEIIATMLLDSGRGALTEATISLPAGFEVQTLAGPRVQSWHRDGSKVFVRLDAQPQHEARVLLHVAKTSAQPVAEWKLEPPALPQFKKFSGHVLVAVHAADDVKLTFDAADRKVREVDPATLNVPITVTPPLMVKRALTVEKADWNAQVDLSRRQPRFVADAVLLAKATDEGFALSQQIGLSVEQGALDHVKIMLPKELPEGIVTGAGVRDVQSKINGALREYDITFQTGELIRADFTLGIDLPLEGEKKLPVVQVDGAARTNVYFITDNVSAHEMKMAMTNAAAATKDAVPFLPGGLLRPQFYRAQPDADVKLGFSQLETTAGNAAIITLAEITTALRANGDRWEIAEFTLANRSLQFLPVRLVEGAELVEVSVGGQNVRADSGGSEKGKVKSQKLYLVPLIQMRAGELAQKVRLVYRLPTTGVLDGLQSLHEPEIVGLAAERTIWNVWVPDEFHAKSFDGNMEEIGAKGHELEKMQSALSDVARLNREIADGRLNGREAQMAWNMACQRLNELTAQKQKPAARGRLDEPLDEARGEQEKEKLGRKVVQLDSDVDKSLQQQRMLLAENATSLKKENESASMGDSFKNVRSEGQLNLDGTVLPGRGNVSVAQGQNWAFNENVPAQKMPAGLLANSGATATSASKLDVNDNVSIAAGGFLGGLGRLTISEVGGVAVPKGGSFGLGVGGTGDVVISGNITSNARAGQNSQMERAAGKDVAVGSSTLSGTGGTTVTKAGSGTFMLNGANSFTGGVTVVGGGTLTLGGTNTTFGGTTATSGTTLTLNGGALTAAPAAPPVAAPMPEPRAGAAAVQPGAVDGLMRGAAVAEKQKKNVLPAKPQEMPPAPGAIAGGAGRLVDLNEPEARTTPQLKPAGRVSLAVDVPLEGKVYSFSKVKDHALLKVSVVRPLEPRQADAMIVLVIGLVALLIFEAVRRWTARRRRARATL